MQNSIRNDDPLAARRLPDESLGHGASPPARGPAAQVLVADHDEVGLDAAGAARDFAHRIAHHDLAARHQPGIVQLA